MARSAELQFLLRMRDEASRVLQQAQATMRSFGASLQQTATRVQGVTHAMTELNNSLQVASQGFDLINSTVGSALSSFSEYEHRLVATQRVAKISASEIDNFSRATDALASKLPALPLSRIQELGESAARAGIQGTEGIMKFTKGMGELETVLEGMGTSAPEQIFRLLTIANEGVDGVDAFNNALFTMSQLVPNSEGRIMELASEVSRATAAFKMGSAEILGLSGAAASIGFAPELFGTTMGRMLQGLDQAARNNTVGMRQLTAATGMTAKEFKHLIDTDPTEAMLLFSDVLGAVVQDGGDVTALLGDFNLATEEHKKLILSMAKTPELFRGMVEASKKSAAEQTSIAEGLQITNEAFYVQTQEAANAWELFKKSVGAAIAPTAIAGLNMLTGALDSMRDSLTSLPGHIQTLLGFLVLVAPAAIGGALAFRALSTALVLMGLPTVMGLLSGLVGLLWGVAAAALGAVPGMLRLGTVMLAAAGPIGALQVAAMGLVGTFAALAAPFATLATLGASLGIVYRLWTNDTRTAEAAARGHAEMLGILDTAMKGLDTSTTEGAAKAREIAMAHYEAALAVQARAAAEAQLALQQADAAMNDWNPLNDITTYFNLDDVHKNLVQANAAVEAIKERMKELGVVAGETSKKITEGIDPSKIDSFNDQYRKLIEDMDQYTKVITALTEKEAALAALRDLPKDAPFFANLGLKGAAIDEYIKRLELMLEMERRRADPVASRVDDIKTEAMAIGGVTAEQQRSLQLIQEAWKLHRETGRDILSILAELEDAYHRLWDAQRRQAVDTTVADLEAQLEGLQAISAEEKNRADINAKIAELERQHGKLKDDEKARITSAMEAAQAAKLQTAFAEQTQTLNDQIAVAGMLTREQENRLEIVQQITEFERENGRLTEAQRQQLAGQMAALQQMQQLKGLVESLDTTGSAQRKFADDSATLKRALDEGSISLEYYTMLMEKLKREAAKELNPFGAELDEINKSMAALQIVGDYRDADRKTLDTIIKLQEKGVKLTEDQVAQLQGLNRAYQDLEAMQSSGIRGWMDSVDTLQKDLLDLTQDFASGLSEAISGALTGDQNAFINFIQKISKRMVEVGVDQILKMAFQSMDKKTEGGINNGAMGFWKKVFGFNLDTPKGGEVGPSPQDLMGLATQSMAVTAGTVILSTMDGSALGGLQGGIPGVANVNGAPGMVSGPAGMPVPGGGAVQGVGGLAGGGDVQKQVWSFFAAKGLKPHQIAGIMGNLSAESAFNPLAVGDGGNAFGLAQWNDRSDELFKFIGGKQNLGDVNKQLEFMWHEMQTTEKGAFNRLMGAGNVDEATAAMIGFERPFGWTPQNPRGGMHYDRRLGAANAAFSTYGQMPMAPQMPDMSMVTAPLQQFGNSLQTVTPQLGQFGSGLSALVGGGGAGGGILEMLLGSFFHGGGEPGNTRPAFSRMMPASTWSGAPRFHTGLKTDEYAAILQRSERVLTANDNARTKNVLQSVAQGGARRGGPIIVNYSVNTPDAGAFHRTEKQERRKMSLAVGRAAGR